MSELRDRARMIAKGAAAVNPPKYYCADFEPHDWVVDAVTAALAESTADLVTVDRELRATRVVVEAAKAWLAHLDGTGAHYRDGIPGELIDAIERLAGAK